MGYFSELQIELQDDTLDFDWQAEQEKDEQELESFYSGSIPTSVVTQEELNDPDNLTGWMDTEPELGSEELRHIEAQAEIQENIHNGYGE